MDALPLSEQLKKLLKGMLAFEEDERPYMQEVVDELRQYQSQEQRPRSPPPMEEFKQPINEPISLEGYDFAENIVPRNNETKVDVNNAKRIATNEAVVIKTFTCDSLQEANQPLREGLAQARFEHPNVCGILDIGLSGSANQCRVHLVMEKMKRNLLQDIQLRSRERRPFTEPETKVFLSQIGEALAFGKAKRIAHRDLKPENILIDSTGQYKLCDFGSAWQRLSLTLTNSAQGTLPYMSREARVAFIDSEARYDPFKADIYSLGMTTLYLCALEPPFRRNANGPGYVNLSTEVIGRLGCSTEMKRLLQQMLSDQPAQRPDIETILSNLRA